MSAPAPLPSPASATLLAIDCATERLCLALQAGGRVWLADEAGGAQASARLLPRVLALLADAGCTPAALDAVAFGRGPGAFTGLRTACAVAQGLAFGAGVPVLALDDLMLVAEAARSEAAPAAALFDTWVAMDARMDEVYAAAYRWRAGRWHALQAPALYTLEALAAAWAASPPAAVAGSALAAFGDRLPLPPAAACHAGEAQRAAALLPLARQAWDEGARLQPADALPLYLRDKVALTTDERMALKAAS
jgi:tRNA threonylcarbamoyladenosine biosynthesis protein TsaB